MNLIVKYDESMATKIYIEYEYMGLLCSDFSSKEVFSRDMQAAIDDPKAKHAISFRFYDVEVVNLDGEELRGKPKNYSETYMINGRAVTLAEVKAMNTDGENDTLISNMECNGWPAVWMTEHGRAAKIPEGAIY